MKKSIKVLIFIVIVLRPLAWIAAAPLAENYLSALRNAIIQGQSNLPAITKHAEGAANEFLLGGNLWVAGRQPDFISEACGRAGGLTSVASLGNMVPTNHDVVLYAVPGPLKERDSEMARQWQERGAAVITFSSPSGLRNGHLPVDTVMNVVDLWTWTGEFVSACTRLGKMPVLYQSYGLPGGYDRAKKYQGKKFHEDLAIEPIPAGVLGRRYREEIERILTTINSAQMPKIIQAAKWWSDAPSAAALVTGHMFPEHFQDPRTPHIYDFIAVPAQEDEEQFEGNSLPSFVLYIGYQFAPQKLLNQTRAAGTKLVYIDVQPGQPPEPTSNTLYIDPGWPLADGCVTVPGYDVLYCPPAE